MVIELLTLSTYQVVIRQNYHTQHFLYPEIRYVFVFERQKERERERREGEGERGIGFTIYTSILLSLSLLSYLCTV